MTTCGLGLPTTTTSKSFVRNWAVNVYALMISLTLSTSLLLWLTSGATLGFIPLVGAVFFILSDSVIGIREFHHDIRNAEIMILSTYCPAIFLLSSGAIFFTF